ncbi:hypothetical protein CASFOL_028913 [Castilleja foliolosa]|uniref:Uncharacterized protein n=1 Tax=Castilleja foliolosa TaxID=1961234 RepID=A0ABD3CFK4_9LAMI
MFQDFHRPDKTKFDMEFKRKRSASSPSSTSSDLTNPKRRSTPAEEDSPLAQLFNDVGIQALVREIKDDCELVQNGKKFLISLHGVMNKSPEESAKYIYDEARQYWDSKISIMVAWTYAIDKEPSLFDKLVFYSNYDAPEQRMIKTINDPWLVYILGDDILGHEQSNDFIRGFLSILIAYWNMKDILFDKYKLGKYEPGRAPTSAPPINWKIESVRYVIDRVDDFKNLREVLESKYGSDPDLVANLFEQMSNFQVNDMRLEYSIWTPGKRAMIGASLCSEESGPFYVCGAFTVSLLP